MHGDDTSDDYSERRLSARLLERRLFDVETRVTAIERSVESFPAIIERKLREQAAELRKSRGALLTRALQILTALAAVVGAFAALHR